MDDDKFLADMVAQTAAAVVAALGGPDQPDGVAKQVASQVESLVASKVEDIRAQVAEASDAALAERDAKIADLFERVTAMAAQAAAPPAPEPADRNDWAESMLPHNHCPTAAGAVLDGRFPTISSFLAAVVNRGVAGVHDERLLMIPTKGDISAALDGENLQSGAALVPEEYRSQLMRIALEFATIRPRAREMPMGSSTLTMPRLRDESRANDTLFGGVQVFWLEAGDDITESEPEFAQIQLTARALAAITELDNTTISDSAQSLPAIVGELFGEAITWKEERTFMRGNGVGKPLGYLESGCVIEVTRESGGANVQADDIHAMEARILPGADMRAVWMIHPGLREDLGKMNLGGVQYWQEDLTSPRPRTLNGRPVLLSEHCSTPGTSGDIILVDWGSYLIGDRMAMAMAASEHVAFDRNATRMRVVARLDGQPLLDSPITLADGSADHTVSPIVTLS